MSNKLKLLILPATGFTLFIIGTIFPLHETVIRNAFMIGGALLTLAFYFITLSLVIKTYPENSPIKIFWLIAIVCLPVIGNVIYIIFIETANRFQRPHGIW